MDFYLKIAETHEDQIERNIVKIIHKLALMKEVKHLILQLVSIAVALDKLQSENASISDCLEQFVALENKCETDGILEPYKHLVEKRFNDCITLAHIVAFLLNPKHIEKDFDPDLEEIGRAWLIKVDGKFLPLLVKFRLNNDIFPKSFFEKIMREKLLPIQWWEALSKNKK